MSPLDPPKRRPKQPQSPEEARRVLQEVVRRADARSKVDFEKLCFGPQLAFVKDDSPLIVGVCSRRAGKSEGIAFKLLKKAAQHPDSPALYITLTRPTAKRNMWPKLLRWNKLLGLGAEFNHADLSMTLPNGGQVILGGANDASEVERYRGLDKGASIAVLDEAQAFRPYIKTLVEDILHPTMIETRGTIVMIGTPNPQSAGYFYDAWMDQGDVAGWSKHHWTILDNPHVPHARQWLEEEVVGRRKIPVTHPKYRREWGGEWCRDFEGLVYPLPHHSLIEDLPEGIDDWRYVLAMDVGYVDATAFVTMAYSVTANLVVTVGSHQRTEMIPSAICAEVDRLSTVYDYDTIVIDPGGGGKFIVEELKKRWELPAKVAQKKAKAAAIDILNGDLRSGAMKIVASENEDLVHDAGLLQWDYARVEKKGGAHSSLKTKELLIIDDRTPDHLLDAQLYGHRECRAYLHEDQHNEPKPGTQAAYDAEAADMLEKAKAAVLAQQSAAEEWWSQ